MNYDTVQKFMQGKSLQIKRKCIQNDIQLLRLQNKAINKVKKSIRSEVTVNSVLIALGHLSAEFARP